MSKNPIPNQRAYARDELLADAIVHGGALVASLFGGGFILAHALGAGGAKVAALVVYVLALVAMLGFSAAYNLTPASPAKWILRRFDHSAIYLMIAGTYTPLLLQLPDTMLAMTLAAIVWGGALAGVVMKVLLPGRFDTLAIGIYLALGWVGVFAAKSFAGVLPLLTMVLIAVGGLLYSAGVPFYLWEKLKFQNAIWHGFVVAAATCHFIAIAWLYVG
jgi:hemolysin III